MIMSIISMTTIFSIKPIKKHGIRPSVEILPMGVIHIGMTMYAQAFQVVGAIVGFIPIYMVYLNKLSVEWIFDCYTAFFTCKVV